jgi:hypothetical protein
MLDGTIATAVASMLTAPSALPLRVRAQQLANALAPEESASPVERRYRHLLDGATESGTPQSPGDDWMLTTRPYHVAIEGPGVSINAPCRKARSEDRRDSRQRAVDVSAERALYQAVGIRERDSRTDQAGELIGLAAGKL